VHWASTAFGNAKKVRTCASREVVQLLFACILLRLHYASSRAPGHTQAAPRWSPAKAAPATVSAPDLDSGGAEDMGPTFPSLDVSLRSIEGRFLDGVKTSETGSRPGDTRRSKPAGQENAHRKPDLVLRQNSVHPYLQPTRRKLLKHHPTHKQHRHRDASHLPAARRIPGLLHLPVPWPQAAPSTSCVVDFSAGIFQLLCGRWHALSLPLQVQSATTFRRDGFPLAGASLEMDCPESDSRPACNLSDELAIEAQVAAVYMLYLAYFTQQCNPPVRIYASPRDVEVLHSLTKVCILLLPLYGVLVTILCSSAADCCRLGQRHSEPAQPSKIQVCM
jgi:Small nuclear RNA activating complex (SNAPc), subunit 1